MNPKYITWGRDYTRELVRRRDNYTCQKCGKEWKEGERRLDVHHLNGVCGKKSGKYDRKVDMDKLITLCHRCHLNLPEVRKKFSEAYRQPSKSLREKLSAAGKKGWLAKIKKEKENSKVENKSDKK